MQGLRGREEGRGGTYVRLARFSIRGDRGLVYTNVSGKLMLHDPGISIMHPGDGVGKEAGT